MPFLYTQDNRAEKEIRETTPFTRVTNNIKYLGVTLSKEVKDLYDKNFKSVKKEIEDLRRWKDLPCSWIGRINIVKTVILPKSFYTFNAIPIKISNTIFSQTLTEKFLISNGKKNKQTKPKQKTPRISQTILTIEDFLEISPYLISSWNTEQ